MLTRCKIGKSISTFNAAPTAAVRHTRHGKRAGGVSIQVHVM
jgi:hypothetical protein